MDARTTRPQTRKKTARFFRISPHALGGVKQRGIHDIIETLYHSGECTCMADKYEKKDNAANLADNTKTPLISEKVIDKALRRIASGKFDPAADIDPDLFEATRSALDNAAREGVGKIAYGHPDHDFYEQLKHNNAVFAAFKTHRQQNELAALLVDENGTPKSFAQFKKDAENIIGDYNINWLQTEYNTALIRARNAVQWRQFGREKETYHNLEWLPSMAAVPREALIIFYHRVWAQDDPFWNSHRPGEVWGCKCGLRSTSRPVTDGNPKSKETVKASPGLDNNPAVDAKLFADSHPYIALANRNAKKAVKKFIAENVRQPEEYKAKKYKSGGELQTPQHGKQNKIEEKKNHKAYELLAKQYGAKYRILPVDNTSGDKNPDAFNLRTKRFSDMKAPVSDNGKNAIQASIRTAERQEVEEVFIYLEKDYPMLEIWAGLKAAIQPNRCEHIREIIIRLNSGEIKHYDTEKLRGVFFKRTRRK